MKKKGLIIVAVLSLMLLSFGIAVAEEWEAQHPNSVLVFPYYTATSGFQTFILISMMDTQTWVNSYGPVGLSPSVHVKFNPKCGRGSASALTLTSKQTLVSTPPGGGEGWVEVFYKTDIADGSSDYDIPLNGYAVILDIANGVSYGYRSMGYQGDIIVDGATEPLNYNDAFPDWGEDINTAIVSNLWRHSNNGRTVIVLLDPNGGHYNDCAGTTLLSNRAQLNLYSKSETETSLQAEWCTGANLGEPGIVTIGVGTTDGVFGTTDASIANPGATITDAPYGYATAYNLRDITIDANAGDWGPGCCGTTISGLLGVSFTRISNAYFPHSTDAQRMDVFWLVF